ncbi:MAG: hypothetical protein U5O69_01290 [Candidatus Competibacteraceae bacterium]|nr:hypothetical protein [Candidatus Competibacteraceae bacterium]
MKRAGGLWPRILSFDNLLLAFRKARRGKRDRVEVARFELDLEPHLLRLQEELAGGNSGRDLIGCSTSSTEARAGSPPRRFATGWCITP